MLVIPDFRIYQEAIDEAWEECGKKLPIIFDDPIVVAIYMAADLELQYFAPIKGISNFAVENLLHRKAEVVQWTCGFRYTEALDYAKKDGITLLGGWLPVGKGTDYWGAAPVAREENSVEGLAMIVAVSGQDHRKFDQPFADAIAFELEERIKEL